MRSPAVRVVPMTSVPQSPFDTLRPDILEVRNRHVRSPFHILRMAKFELRSQ
jgi:hypothetical protein